MHAQIYLQVMENNGFLIPLNGLARGKTRSRSRVGKEFFEKFDNTEILDAGLLVSTEIEKSGQYIGIDCHISGTVTVPCDRCLDPVAIPVGTCARLSLKFAAGEGDDTEDGSGREIVRLSEDNTEFDLSQVIYDYVCLSLPPRRLHPEGGCNPEAMKYLEHGISVRNAGGDNDGNPFMALKDLLGN